MSCLKLTSLRFSILLSLVLIALPIFSQAQSGHKNRISLSLYQVGVPMEALFGTPVHRFLSGLYYERALHDQWQLSVGGQYWNGTYSEGANLPNTGPDGIGQASLEDMGFLLGVKYLPAWCRLPFLQPLVQYDLMLAQSRYSLRSANPNPPGGFSQIGLNSLKLDGFLRAGMETYCFQSRIVLSAMTAYRLGASWIQSSTMDDDIDVRRIPRGTWIPLELRVGFQF